MACVENVDASNTSPFKYHGKVQFSAKLSFKKDRNGELRLVLDQPELGSSSRFTRRFGSDWLIRIRIHKDLVNSKSVNLREYFMKPFIFFDRVYRAFYARFVTSYFTYQRINDECINLSAKSAPCFLWPRTRRSSMVISVVIQSHAGASVTSRSLSGIIL